MADGEVAEWMGGRDLDSAEQCDEEYERDQQSPLSPKSSVHVLSIHLQQHPISFPTEKATLWIEEDGTRGVSAIL